MVLLLIFFISCKNKEENKPQQSTQVELEKKTLECEPFNSRQQTSLPVVTKYLLISVHKGDPNKIVYTIRKDTTGPSHFAYYLNLATGEEKFLFKRTQIQSIDINKYGELVAGVNSGGEVLLGQCDNPNSIHQVSDEQFYGVTNTNWLFDGEMFSYTITLSQAPPIVFRDRKGNKVSEKFSDTVFQILDYSQNDKLIVSTHEHLGFSMIGTCDTLLKNFNPIFKSNSPNGFLDVEYVSDYNLLNIISPTEWALYQVGSLGEVKPTPLHCQNIIINDIDYSPISKEYFMVIAVGQEIGTEPIYEQYLCKSKLIDKKVTIIKRLL